MVDLNNQQISIFKSSCGDRIKYCFYLIILKFIFSYKDDQRTISINTATIRVKISIPRLSNCQKINI
jgi:hypothetical protein